MTLTSRTEQRIVIKHSVPVGMTPMDTHMFVYMFRWHNILSDGCDDISDCKRSARPKIDTENVMKSVWEKMSANFKRIQK